MNSRTMAKGRPVRMEAVCRARSPPPISNTAATKPSNTAQKIRCFTGGFVLPPAVMMSITSEPESDEVIKKVKTTRTASPEVMLAME